MKICDYCGHIFAEQSAVCYSKCKLCGKGMVFREIETEDRVDIFEDEYEIY